MCGYLRPEVRLQEALSPVVGKRRHPHRVELRGLHDQRARHPAEPRARTLVTWSVADQASDPWRLRSYRARQPHEAAGHGVGHVPAVTSEALVAAVAGQRDSYVA